MQELSKAYNPKETEGRIYDLWQKAEAFKPKIGQRSTVNGQHPFVIAIPPPNVTGSLHMGHALNNTIQDILIRRSRMKGVPTLWIPGTDHAGIATQNVVEKALAKKGISRQELGRDKFVQEINLWVDQYGHTIIDQLKAMGCSCDWSRQRFTMDDGYSEAVNAAFKHYHDKGWIYQGERVINWCTRCQTALSDIEVEHQDQTTKLYYFKYDKNFPITIATTRPETKLGDTAVAVNPKDKRYQDFIDKTFKVNFVGVERDIKIIADQSIDIDFGTGAVGVTPAHSLVDAELAEKHGLDTIKVIDQYGRMTPEAGLLYEGLKVAEAQEKIIEKLKADGLLEKTDEINNALSVCYRCSRPIEPQPSKQWFLKMSELAKPAIEAVEKGEIKFVPARWNKVYLDWMKNLKDWCISRQIWWGHKIPIEGETDVLDTWFSSALWPFATLGWPACHSEHFYNTQCKLREESQDPSALPQDDRKNDLSYFYPNTIMTTARDIIYLWVARMIFSGYEFMGEKPFETVYIHPTIFNKEGKRMSKSLGTGVDPLELIEKYGADATRFGLTYINTGIQDLKFDEEAIKAGQKFANKIWNVARFVMMSICHPEEQSDEGSDPQVILSEAKDLDSSPKAQNDKIIPQTEADKKILNSLRDLVNSVNSNLDQFKFGQMAHDLYDFVWHDLADIYIEESKKVTGSGHPEPQTGEGTPEEKENTQKILLYTLTSTLRLLHPVMPFVTEEIWQNLYENKLVSEELLISASWPIAKND